MGCSSFLFAGFLLSGGNCNDSASGSFLFICFLIRLLWFCFKFFFLCLFGWNSEFLSILEILCSCCEIVVLFNLCYH